MRIILIEITFRKLLLTQTIAPSNEIMHAFRANHKIAIILCLQQLAKEISHLLWSFSAMRHSP